MSNLGWYQRIVELSSKVGGPKNLLCLTVLGGAVIGAGTYAGGEAAVKRIKTARASEARASIQKNVNLIVTTPGESNEGVKFELGDWVRVLAVDGNAVLIEKNGDESSPCFISKELLNTITNQIKG